MFYQRKKDESITSLIQAQILYQIISLSVLCNIHNLILIFTYYKIFFWILFFDCIALGYLGAMPAEGWYVLASRICTGYYFFHFLIILPLLPKFEPTKPLPIGINTPILQATSPLALRGAVYKKE